MSRIAQRPAVRMGSIRFFHTLLFHVIWPTSKKSRNGRHRNKTGFSRYAPEKSRCSSLTHMRVTPQEGQDRPVRE